MVDDGIGLSPRRDGVRDAGSVRDADLLRAGLASLLLFPTLTGGVGIEDSPVSISTSGSCGCVTYVAAISGGT